MMEEMKIDQAYLDESVASYGLDRESDLNVFAALNCKKRERSESEELGEQR